MLSTIASSMINIAGIVFAITIVALALASTQYIPRILRTFMRDRAKAVSRMYAIDTYRTVDQDAGFGIRQLVDIALKALSPGINNTTTPITCIEFLSVILRQCASRRIESPAPLS